MKQLFILICLILSSNLFAGPKNYICDQEPMLGLIGKLYRVEMTQMDGQSEYSVVVSKEVYVGDGNTHGAYLKEIFSEKDEGVILYSSPDNDNIIVSDPRDDRFNIKLDLLKKRCSIKINHNGFKFRMYKFRSQLMNR